MILAYLAEAPEHGYRLVERMRQDDLQLLSDFSVPNIYHALRKLHRNEAVELRIKKSRARPDQKIYSITQKGREMLAGFLTDDSLHDQRIRFRSDLVLVLERKLGLDPPQVADALTIRIDKLSEALEGVQASLRDSQTVEGGLSPIGEIAFRHQIRFLKSEIDFYRKALRELGPTRKKR
jgi:DNA-binding PadR family transcriptional regulator